MKKYSLLWISCCFTVVLYSQEYNSEILSRRVYIEASKGKLTRIDTTVLQVNARQGDDDATIAIYYSKGDRLTLGDAWIEDNNGNVVRKLKKSDITDRSAISGISLYEDDFVKIFELKHNIYPYRVVYSYKYTTSDFLEIINWEPNPKRMIPIRDMKLVLETAKDYQVRYKQDNMNAPVEELSGNNWRLTWNLKYTPEKRQQNASRESLKLPHIRIVPLDFKYDIPGNWESWEQFGDWIYKLNAKAHDLPESEKTKINRLLTGVNDNVEKAKVLFYYLQEYTRYVNVAIKTGGLKTYPASYVATNKYGDCKALTNYMQAMLEYVGIPSYYTLVKSGDEIETIDKSFPSQSFDHVILTVPFDRDTIFLECTAKNIPFGYMGTFTQGREALMVDGGGKSRFVTIPPLTEKDVVCLQELQVPLNTGQAKVDMKITQRGGAYEFFLFLATDVNRNVAEQFIRNNGMKGSFEITSFQFEKQPRNIAEIDFVATLKMNNLYKVYGDNMMITPFPHDFPVYEQPDKRTQDFQFYYPVVYTDTLIYLLPPNGKVELPENIVIESKFGYYKIIYRLNANKLIASKDIVLHRGRYPLSDYEAFYQFITAVKSNESKNLYLKKL